MKFTKLFSSVRLLDRGLNYGRVGTRSVCTLNSPPQDGGDKNVDANKKGLVVGVYQTNNKLELTPIGEEVNQKSGDKISQHLNELSSEMKLGKAFALTDVMPEYSAVAITSLGPKDAGYNVLESLDEARENIRWGVGAGVTLLKSRGCSAIDVDPATAPDAAAEAAELAAWRFQHFKSAYLPEIQLNVYGNEGKELWSRGSIRARGQNWARFLTDMPANNMTPVDLAQAALDTLCPLGVVIEAHEREWIEAQRMRAFLAVAKGSCEAPMFLDCSYRGASPTLPPVLLAAKGVTFDSGGLCLKECYSMIENRGSMAGAAVVLAAVKIIAELKIPINVSVVIPICENMVSGQCMKVGDVVRALNGLSIQIENTDMEGRLMMADALVYGQSLYKPSLVIDVATFTRGVLMATGGGAFGCFSNSDGAWHAVQAAGARSGDRPWRFPLWQYFQKQITNDPSVDLRNKGAGHATPCLGAAFLKLFLVSPRGIFIPGCSRRNLESVTTTGPPTPIASIFGDNAGGSQVCNSQYHLQSIFSKTTKNFVCSDWVHMDITGVGKVAHASAPPYLNPRRMTGRPARTLATLLEQIVQTRDAEQPQHPQTCAATD